MNEARTGSKHKNTFWSTSHEQDTTEDEENVCLRQYELFFSAD